MLKSFTVEAFMLMIAFLMIMPLVVLSTAESTLSSTASIAKDIGSVNIAVASDYTNPLPSAQQSDTVAALIAWVQDALSTDEKE